MARRARLSWALQALEIDALWHEGLRGEGVRIGHLDTGVAGAHPALDGKIARFVEFDPLGQPAANQAPRDTASHGTHTAGILCGSPIGGTHIGVAPAARLHSAAVIDGGENIVRILRGLDWLRGSGIRVLCMALGIPADNPVLSTLLEALRREGVLLVCPIGNTGSAAALAPGNHPNVLAVGAVDRDGALAPTTGRVEDRYGVCQKPELLAPGVGVGSAHPQFRTAVALSGSSQACAFVAGVAALLIQACPEATPAQVRAALLQTARPIDQRQGQRYRHGLIRPRQALETLRSGAVEEVKTPRSPPLPWYRDPDLAARWRFADAREQLGGVLLVSRRTPSHRRQGRAATPVERVASRLREQPADVDYLPAARAAILRASPRFLEALSNTPEVQVLTGTRVPEPESLL